MKKFYRVFVLLIFTLTLRAQNLVPNPSFEIYSQCPNQGGHLDYALYWINPLTGGGSSPDYMNACGSWSVPINAYGYEPARTGVAYAAIVTAKYNPAFPAGNNSREYLEVELMDTLQANQEYCFSFYVSACDSEQYVSNNIGIYFSNSEIQDTNPSVPQNLPYTPQFENDSTNDLSSRVGWTEVSGKYKAVGGEKFIVIGNFRDTTATVATYVGWSNHVGSYYAAYYVDDIYLVACDTIVKIANDLGLINNMVYPNPSDGIFFLDQDENQIENVEIFDCLGNIMIDSIIFLQDRVTINIRDKPNGLYLLSITTSTNKYFLKLFKT